METGSSGGLLHCLKPGACERRMFPAEGQDEEGKQGVPDRSRLNRAPLHSAVVSQCLPGLFTLSPFTTVWSLHTNHPSSSTSTSLTFPSSPPSFFPPRPFSFSSSSSPNLFLFYPFSPSLPLPSFATHQIRMPYPRGLASHVQPSPSTCPRPPGLVPSAVPPPPSCC